MSLKNKKLKDKIGDEILPNDVYSYDEVCIGRWVDNKPLYRKVYKNTVPNPNVLPFDYSFINVEELSVDNVISITGFVKIDSNAVLNIPFIFENASSQQLIGVYYSNKYIHYSTNVSSYKGKLLEIIIEYTKTTD